MADIRITDVPTTSAITDADYLYIRTGNNFRRVLVSALMTLIGSEISVTPEPDFNQKCLAMKLQNGIYVIDNANSDFIGTDYQTFAMFAAAIQQAHMDGYDVFCTIFDGQYQNAVPFLGNLGGAMLKFGGWEFSADGLQPVVYTYTETYGFVREVIAIGSGGGVVPAPGVGDEGKVPMVVNGVVVWAAIPETTTSEIDAIIAAI